MFQAMPDALKAAGRAHGVTAVLGPTNTGKTHYAIERMLGHASGIIGLPLRLLAREVYNRVVERVGAQHVALITGEEKIKPKHARYWVATVEAMPRDLDVAFIAIDEIQLATNLDRGHVFTDRLLNRRGAHETLVIGAETMRRALDELMPGINVVTRPRLSSLTFMGERKLTRLPRRSAIVAFSAEEVYAIAELIRRQRGGAAVVLGALSPRTRNAQIAMYQAGEVDYIVATDAIGMGLNLDVDHVAFAGDRKFDGWHYRRLTPAEFGQIAGRAGRHVRDGTFGTTGRCSPFDEDLVEALENHRFDPIPTLQWRNALFDFTSIAALQASLDLLPAERGLSRTPIGEDLMILDIASRDATVVRATKTRADVQRLWEACQIPDYRKVSPNAHAELVLTVYGFIVRAGHVPDDWLARQLATLDRIDGDIDALSARIAQVRTWTYIANRSDWMGDPEHWQSVTRQVEDNLSDALHERLAQRFVDRRTSVLMRRLRENAMLEAEVTITGDVMVEGLHIGQLHGFRFTPDPLAAGEAARTLNAAAQKALASEIEARATKVHEAVDEAFVLANDGQIRWLGEAVGRMVAGDKVLEPRVRVLADEQLTGPALENVQRRLDLWLQQHTKKLLGGLFTLEAGEGLDGIARGIGFQIAEALGVLERTKVAEELKALEQPARADLRKMGVRFGAYHIYIPQLLKPAPRALASQLWSLSNGNAEGVRGLEEVPHLAASGRTSFKVDKDVSKSLYRAAGFRVCGERAVRVDILERLADLIRPAINYRPGVSVGDPPPGAADRDGFIVTVGMTSLAGCSGDDFGSILRSLGYVVDRRPGPAITVPLIAAASMQPIRAMVPDADGADGPEAGPASVEGADVPEAGAPVAEASAGDGSSADPSCQPPVAGDGSTTPSEPSPSGTGGERGADMPTAEASVSDPSIFDHSRSDRSDLDPSGSSNPSAEPSGSHLAEPETPILAAPVALPALHVDPDVIHTASPSPSHMEETPAAPAVAAPGSQSPAALEALAVDVAVAHEDGLHDGDLHEGGLPGGASQEGALQEGALHEGGHQGGLHGDVLHALPLEPATDEPMHAVSGHADGVEHADAAAQGSGPEATEHAPPSASDGTTALPPQNTGTLSAEGSPAPDENAEAAAAEALLIEVWRPHRHHQAPQRRPADRRPRERTPNRRSEASETVPPTVVEGALPSPSAKVAADVAADPAQSRIGTGGGDEAGSRHQGGRRDQHRVRQPSSGGPNPAQREFRRPRPEERRDAPRREEQRAAPAAKPSSRERAPDPNSPFAKLAALKIELERKSRGLKSDGDQSDGKDS